MYDYGAGWEESLAFKAFSYPRKNKTPGISSETTEGGILALLCAAHLTG